MPQRVGKGGKLTLLQQHSPGCRTCLLPEATADGVNTSMHKAFPLQSSRLCIPGVRGGSQRSHRAAGMFLLVLSVEETVSLQKATWDSASFRLPNGKWRKRQNQHYHHTWEAHSAAWFKPERGTYLPLGCLDITLTNNPQVLLV